MRAPSSLTESPIPAFGIAIGGVLAFAALVRGLFDPDYFWHLATGRLIVETRSIPMTDPFSFSWFGEPWIPDQWLAQVLIAAIVDSAGPPVLLILFAAVAAAGLALVCEALRLRGVRLRAIVPLMILAAAAILPQVTARPQVLSFGFGGLVIALLLVARAERHLLWSLPVIFLLWANIHGFFVVGLGIGFAYLVATFLGRTPMSARRWTVLAVGVASLVATMITPQGPDGLLYAISFGDTGDWGARNIAEWQSPNFHDPQFLPFLLVIVTFLALGLRGLPGWLTTVGLVGMILGLIAIRTIGMGVIMMLPAAILAADRWLPASSLKPSDAARRGVETGAATVVAVAAVVFALMRGSVTVDARSLPVAGTELLSERMPDARVLASYGWGGYVLSELYDSGGRVFVDGRMHKYAPDVIDEYNAIINADAGWEELVEKRGVEAILLKPEHVLVKGIAQEAGWCEAHRDELEVLLLRDCGQESG
jgi:hypothetical protein